MNRRPSVYPSLPSTVLLATVSLAFACTSELGGVAPDSGEPISLAIQPAGATIRVHNGVAEAVAYKAVATYESGAHIAIDDGVSWRIDDLRFGDFEIGGLFTASGFRAGVGTITASIDGLVAQTDVHVVVDVDHTADGFPDDGADRFSDDAIVGGTTAPRIVYPLSDAVIPSSLPPMTAQWQPEGSDGDLYRLRVRAGDATVTAYEINDGSEYDFAWLVDHDSWSLLRASNDGDMQFVIDRWEPASSQTFRSETVGLQMVDAQVTGAIYYWELDKGQIVRITEAGGREEFLPNPPAEPDTGRRCVACHTVSRDGRSMAASLWGGGKTGAVFDLTQSLMADPAPTAVGPGRYDALFSTFDPAGERLLINIRSRLELRRASDGALLSPTGTPLPTSGAANPTWSPDGKSIAYIANHNGTWGVDYSEGDLAVIPVMGADEFGATRVVRPADGKANSWPTFSPDSEWVAYARGTHSRARRVETNEVFPGSLRMIHRDGGEEYDLVRASGGEQNSHLPSFSPFIEGGYLWLAFYSTRDYGNDRAGTAGTDRRQLWITAIEMSPEPDKDPSRVAFWLPGQNPETENMSAYWTLEPPID